MDRERDGKGRRRLGGGDELRAGASCLSCHGEVQHGICHWSLGRGQREAWESAAGEEAASEERRGSGRHGDRHRGAWLGRGLANLIRQLFRADAASSPPLLPT